MCWASADDARCRSTMSSESGKDAHDQEGGGQQQESAKRAELDEGRLDIGELGHTTRHADHPKSVHWAEDKAGSRSEQEGLQDGGPIAYSRAPQDTG